MVGRGWGGSYCKRFPSLIKRDRWEEAWFLVDTLVWECKGWCYSSRPDIRRALVLDECHALHVKSLRLCLTLCSTRDCSLPGSSVQGIFQARILEWVTMPFSRESFLPRDWTQVPWIAGGFFTIWVTREALFDECQWSAKGKKRVIRTFSSLLTHCTIGLHNLEHLTFRFLCRLDNKTLSIFKLLSFGYCCCYCC